MATKSIDWNDGSGDKIYLTYPSASGDQTVQVTSDANRGSSRTKVVTFSTGNISRQLTINQEAGGPQSGTLVVNPSSYDNSDYQYAGLANVNRAYADENSTTYCQINLTTGAQAETWIYFCFDTSSIPSNAIIDSVSCTAKTYATNASATNIPVKEWQLYAGTTPKGSPANVNTGSAGQSSVSGASWTAEEVAKIRLWIYARRGTSNVSNNYGIRLYGATLTVEWHI